MSNQFKKEQNLRCRVAMVERLGELRKGRRERIEKGSRERLEKRETNKRELRRQFEGEEEQHHLPLLVVQFPQGTAVLL